MLRLPQRSTLTCTPFPYPTLFRAQLHHLRRLGLRVTPLEAGAGLGGLWHWNCYPGARVDSHIPLYEYSDPDLWQDWYWDERFPDWQALRRYFKHFANVWGLRADIRFQPRLTAAEIGRPSWRDSM